MIANLLNADNVVFTGVNIILAWGVYLALMTGTLSFAMAAFMAIGAYVSGVLTVNFGVPFAPAALHRPKPLRRRLSARHLPTSSRPPIRARAVT